VRRVTIILSVLIGTLISVVPAVIDAARAAISPTDQATLQQAANLLSHKQPPRR
jgi:hypothetical protein